MTGLNTGSAVEQRAKDQVSRTDPFILDLEPSTDPGVTLVLKWRVAFGTAPDGNSKSERTAQGGKTASAKDAGLSCLAFDSQGA